MTRKSKKHDTNKVELFISFINDIYNLNRPSDGLNVWNFLPNWLRVGTLFIQVTIDTTENASHMPYFSATNRVAAHTSLKAVRRVSSKLFRVTDTDTDFADLGHTILESWFNEALQIRV